MQLTLVEKSAIQRGEPVSVKVDDTECVVLRCDVYERSRHSADEYLSPDALYNLVESAMAEDDANDPALDSYQHFKQAP